MLTRLEVEGFKNMRDVAVDLGPFTCIAGENGVGKSNVMDAIEFMAMLADDTLIDAAQQVRGDRGGRGADPRDLFWSSEAASPRMRLAAEMIVPRIVEDDLGAETRAATTFLRYEIVLGYLPPTGEARSGRLSLLGESLTHITKGDARSRLSFPHSAAFRNAVVTGERRGGAFLSTAELENGTVVNVHGDGGSRGRPQPRAVARAGRSVLSTVTTNEYPTILAARREMQSWRRLALEPTALRSPDGFDESRSLATDGRHLASALFRVSGQEGDTDAQRERVYARIAGRLADLSGVGVDRVTVDVDPVREMLTVHLIERSGLNLAARALSEGTLRFLALCVLLEDPDVTGVVCMEEPENGIHPANLTAIVELVRDLAVDAYQPPDASNPFRQVVINTHSPGVVQIVGAEELLYAENVTLASGQDSEASELVLLPWARSWRAAASPDQPAFSKIDVLPYLSPPPGTQLGLDLGLSMGQSA